MSKQFTDQNFKEEVLDFQGVALVDFFAPWCGPCQMQGPIIDELAVDEAMKDFKIGKMNVDEAPETAGKFGVMSIPTLIIFKNGEPVETLVGMQASEVLKEKLLQVK